jgi:hypothetical protein
MAINMNFAQQVFTLRAAYPAARDKHNLYGHGPNAYKIEERDEERINRRHISVFWLSTGKYIRLVDVPGSLSGDILRLKTDLPDVDGNFEIDGDEIRQIEVVPSRPGWWDTDDSEDVSKGLEALLTVEIDEDIHHLKKSICKSEIQTLLKCQGGSCLGSPLSPIVIRLLEKTEEGKLVFPALRNRIDTLYRVAPSIAIYKRWSSHLIETVRALHDINIVHRDLNVENLLWTDDGQQLIVSDLECHWESRRAPELRQDLTLDAGWSKQSDIYDVGCLIEGFIYGNVPPNNQVEWTVPEPFDRIVAACKRDVPGD